MIPKILIILNTILVILVALRYLKIEKVFSLVLELVTESLELLFNKEVSDLQKEHGLRKFSIDLMKASINLTLLVCVIICSLMFIPILLWLNQTWELNQSLGYMLSLDYLLITIILLMLISIFGKFKQQHSTNLIQYNPAYKIVHRLAFTDTFMKITASLDDLFTPKKYRDVDGPIFITGIARSGSTALLNAFYSVSNFGTFTYRDVPFSQLIYTRSRFRFVSFKRTQLVERAHGDGHQINLDTPEAFEEIFWLMHFRSKYNQNVEQIKKEDISQQIRLKFQNFVSKVAVINCSRSTTQSNMRCRYVSKNNANLSRYAALKDIFPAAIFVVPIRKPLEHAFSLFQQHQRFTELQMTDKFVKQYMDDIGHFEFGLSLKPLQLNCVFESIYDNNNPNYWLDYWIYCHSYIWQNVDDFLIVDLESLISNENATMSKLMKKICDRNQWESDQKFFKKSNSRPNNFKFDPKLIDRAEETYKNLFNSRC